MECEYAIIGSGIIGLAVARSLKRKQPTSKVVIFDKERKSPLHASGRNSGVIHAGFYYTSDSLKAKFTREGNQMLTHYCEERNLKINKCGKVVVARIPSEKETILELERRGKKNGVEVRLIDSHELAAIEPNAKTCEIALYSPTTSTADPLEVSNSLRQDLINSGVEFVFGDGFQDRIGTNQFRTINGASVTFRKIVNCAGLYADKIARKFDLSSDYQIMPFKGLYLNYSGNDRPVRTNIYPVPNLENPFLGVHFTVKVDGKVKIGPTAIPAFWRENYYGLKRSNFSELREIVPRQFELFVNNTFGFRDIALKEVRKYAKSQMAKQSLSLVRKIDTSKFNKWGIPGIRAQLYDTSRKRLVSDFTVECGSNSIHILNAVSPAWTSSFPFADWVVESHIMK